MSETFENQAVENGAVEGEAVEAEAVEAEAVDAFETLERALRSAGAAGSGTGRPPVLEGADVTYAVEDTAVGRLLLASRRDGVLVASAYAATDEASDALLDRLARSVSARVLRVGTSGRTASAPLDDVRRQLEEYLTGRRRRFEVRAEPVLATAFQRQVLARLAASVGYGERMSYGALAAGIGRPSASRAVGAALGANPLCIVLPCHRVVASSGALTGYAGGLDAKRLLLDLESRPDAPR
jgi:methylated-DNA-[protein]-cysteine S-methyltransferase